MRIQRIFALAFITGFSGAMMPGPFLAMTIGQVGAVGFMAAVWLLLGHAALELLLLVLLVAGLRVVLARAKVRGAIALIGGAALFYMGVDMIRNAAGVQIGMSGAVAAPAGELVLLGALISLANPYFTGWWATIGVGQLAHTCPQNNREYLAFYVGHELSDVAWYSFVAVLVVLAQQWLEGAWYHWLIALCGGAIALLALWFLYNGIMLVFNIRRPDGKLAAPGGQPDPRRACGRGDRQPEE